MVNDLKVRPNHPQGSNCAFKVRPRTDGRLPDELVARVHCFLEMEIHKCKESFMAEFGVRGIDLFKIAGESISGWIPSWKTGAPRPTRQPFCSQMEEQLLLYQVSD